MKENQEFDQAQQTLEQEEKEALINIQSMEQDSQEAVHFNDEHQRRSNSKSAQSKNHLISSLEEESSKLMR